MTLLLHTGKGSRSFFIPLLFFRLLSSAYDGLQLRQRGELPPSRSVSLCAGMRTRPYGPQVTMAALPLCRLARAAGRSAHPRINNVRRIAGSQPGHAILDVRYAQIRLPPASGPSSGPLRATPGPCGACCLPWPRGCSGTYGRA